MAVLLKRNTSWSCLVTSASSSGVCGAPWSVHSIRLLCFLSCFRRLAPFCVKSWLKTFFTSLWLLGLGSLISYVERKLRERDCRGKRTSTKSSHSSLLPSREVSLFASLLSFHWLRRNRFSSVSSSWKLLILNSYSLTSQFRHRHVT